EVEGEVVATSRSDASGTFVFVRLPARELIVRAVTDAPQVGAIRFDLAATLRGVVVVRTMPARRVHGTVRDGSGKPVAGAWVGCTPLGAPEFAVAASQATTDADGRFELSHVPYAETAMRVWHVGHAGFATEIAAPGDVQADVVLTDE